MSKHVIIRNPKSGLVLDGTETVVRIQEFKGYDIQRWILQCNGYGRFVIMNVRTGNCMDAQRGEGTKIITARKDDGLNQEWFINGDGSIQSALNNLVVDIYNQDLFPGNFVQVVTKKNIDGQLFQIE